jgi:hypothetical protein
MGEPVSAKELLRLRLAAQYIDPVGVGDIAATVRHLVAMQAQDFAQALWAIAQRSRGATRSDVLAALAAGTIVRTLPMRGTLHFIAPEDLRWMLRLTAARSLQSAATRFRGLGLDRETLDRAEAVAALAGGNALGRDEFMKLLASNGISPDGQRGYHIIFYLTQRMVVCWGPPSGTQQALVLVDEWIPATPWVDRQTALETFALRYFTSHGPATERDFAWWTKLTLSDVRSAIAALGPRLSTLTHGSVDYLIATDALESASGSALGTRVQVLPGFDEYLLGYQERSLALPTEHATRIAPGSNGIFLPTIVSNGVVCGTWRRVTGSKTNQIQSDHFSDATAARLKAFEQAAARYSRFMAG